MRILDLHGVELPSEQEQATGVPDWLKDDPLEWPVSIEVSHTPGQPDKFIFGKPAMRAVVLIDSSARPLITVEDLVTLAAGAYKALAQAEPTRPIAELIAKAWLVQLQEHDATRH